MAKMKHSEAVAKIAVDGIVAGFGGTVKGELGLKPRVLSPLERTDLGVAAEVGDVLFYPIDDGGVFMHAHGAFHTIWFAAADCDVAITALHNAVKRAYPNAKQSVDAPHATEPGFQHRSYDVQLPNGRLAVVEAIYPAGRVDNPKFMVRVTAFDKQQKK